MPLIRVTGEDRKVSKLIVAETLSDALIGAMTTFNLNGLESEFKLCIDDGVDEGTQVDCDRVFQELLKDCAGKNRLSLIILRVNLEWKKVGPDSSAFVSASGQLSSSTPASSSSSSSSQPNSPGSVSPLQSIGNPSSCLMEGWSPLPMREISLALDPVLKLLGEPSNQQPRNIFKLKQDAIKAAFKSITQHILLSVKDYRRCVAVHYAKSIFSFQEGLYKPIFAQSVNREVIGDGFDDFVLKVYNAISYGKPSELKKRRGKRTRPVVSSDQESDPDDPNILVNSCRNSVDYGCVAYNPPSPVGETPETQEDKRRLLLELAEDNSAEVNKLLRLTYASQRSEIIACKPLKKIATDFFPRWPHFKVAINLLQHAKVLMGKDVLAIFSEQLIEKGKEICNFMEAIAAAEGTSNQTAKVKRAERILKTFEDLDNACGNERTAIYLSTAAVPSIANYFNEDLRFMLQVIPSGASDNDILIASKNSNGNPIIVISGDSIFDESAYPYLVIQNAVIVKCVDFLQSLAVYIASFFIFGYWYTNEVKCTIEFIQRFLLNLNPERGSKVIKRFSGNANSKVVKLSNELQTFTSPWALGIQ